MSNLFVYVILVNWNNYKDTIECIESLLKINYKNYKIIVVDNASSDNSSEYIKEWVSSNKIELDEYDDKLNKVKGTKDSKLTLINNNYNAGFAGGNNLGIQLALKKSAEYVWLINNDTIVDKEALSELVNLALTNNKIGIVGSKLMSYYEKNIIQAVGGWLNLKSYITNNYYGNNVVDSDKYNKIIEPDYIKGASMLISGKLIQEIGLIDENYFLYWEETDFCVRARKNGWKLYYCPKSIVWHKEGATTKTGSKTCTYYYTRNSLYFYKKHYHGKFIIIFLFGFIYKILKRLINGDFYSIKYIMRAYFDFINKRFGRAEL